jgi:hypothetical protein
VASAENVDVQVRHGFAAVRAIVDDALVAAHLLVQKSQLHAFLRLGKTVEEI